MLLHFGPEKVTVCPIATLPEEALTLSWASAGAGEIVEVGLYVFVSIWRSGDDLEQVDFDQVIQVIAEVRIAHS